MSLNQDSSGQQRDESSYTLRVTVRITKKPNSAIRFYRGGTARQLEVVTEGIILGAGGSDHYTVRFVHDRTLSDAQTLRPGDLIHVTQSRLQKYPGRKETELHVKRFHRVQGLPPV